MQPGDYRHLCAILTYPRISLILFFSDFFKSQGLPFGDVDIVIESDGLLIMLTILTHNTIINQIERIVLICFIGCLMV